MNNILKDNNEIINIIQEYEMKANLDKDDVMSNLVPFINKKIDNIETNKDGYVTIRELCHLLAMVVIAFEIPVLKSVGKDYDFGSNVKYNIYRKVLPPLYSVMGKFTKEMALALMGYDPRYKLGSLDEARMYARDIVAICIDLITSLLKTQERLDFKSAMEEALQ